MLSFFFLRSHFLNYISLILMNLLLLFSASLGSKRFTGPCAYEYVSSDLLQFVSMRFAGDFSHGEKMNIYGFVAVRDEIDHLRNYIFDRPSDHAQEITPVSILNLVSEFCLLIICVFPFIS
jgi:hypothetical protein